jgi:hypothetical protein
MSVADTVRKGRDLTRDKAQYREALLSLFRARIQHERAYNARPRRVRDEEMEGRKTSFNISELCSGSFDAEVGYMPAVAPELWALQTGIRKLAKMAPQFFDSCGDIEDMCQEFTDLLEKEASVDPQWTMSVFNVAFDGCSFKSGGTWYA